ncbi:MAG: hypothetical protein KJO10_09020, partial [Gammaproteobacteria bacterium]|nr:hypothetical protein [Gammaproteobacteria bacterium]
DCMDAGGRAMQEAKAEAGIQPIDNLSNLCSIQTPWSLRALHDNLAIQKQWLKDCRVTSFLTMTD